MGATTLKDGVMFHVLTKELYLKHKIDGWNDRRIMSRYGLNNQSLNEWKNVNLTDEERAKHRLRRGAPAKTLEQAKEEKASQKLPAVKAADVRESLVGIFDEIKTEKPGEELMENLQSKVKQASNQNPSVDYEEQYKRLYMEYRRLAEANEELKKEVNHLHSACDDLENDNASFEKVEILEKELAHLRSILDDRLTKDVLANVAEERRQQNKLWGKQRHDYSYWLAILVEEIGEVAQAIQKGSVASKATDAGNLYVELIQTAAVAVAIAEQVAEGDSHE